MDVSIDKLAKRIAELMKENRNPPSTAPRIAEIVAVNPIKVQWGASVVLTEDRLRLPTLYSEGYLIPNRYQNTNGSMVDETLLWKPELQIGDKVLIVPDEFLKIWYVIDKVVGTS